MSCTDPWVLEEQQKREMRRELEAANQRNQLAERPTPTEKKIEDLEREVLQMKVHMQAQQLDELTEKVERDRNPAVKDAWEKYQTVLRLARK